MKANSVIETKVSTQSENGVTDYFLSLNFVNGKELIIGTRAMSNEMLYTAAMHGLKQKLCDAAAMSRDPETGKPATVEQKYEAVKEVYDRLLTGEWNATREGGGVNGGLLYRAICKMYEGKRSPEELKVWLAAKSDDEKKALRDNKKIAKIIESLRPVDKKAASIDSNALLADLG